MRNIEKSKKLVSKETCQSDLKKSMLDRQELLMCIVEECAGRLKTAPKGTLRISWTQKSRTGEQIQYYYREETSDRSGSYISKKDSDLIRRLAQKDYDKRIMEAAQKELRAIRSGLQRYPEICFEEVYSALSDVRRRLIEPIIETDEEYIRKWKAIPYEGKKFLESTQELLTDQGERVRSKSELIIANLLARKSIPYRYEFPVELPGFGTVYPDFTVLNVRLRKEMYWEHFGMMDNPEYAQKAVQKLASYNNGGYFEGDKLIVTAETMISSINVRQINGVIERYLS